jgi:replicative DNA helicase
MLISNEAIGEVTDILEPEHFSDEGHRQIYIALCELAKRGTGPISAGTLLEELGSRLDLDKAGATAYWRQMVESVPSPGYAQHYVEIVRKWWFKRHAAE